VKKINIIENPEFKKEYEKKIKVFERKHRVISELILGISLILVWRGIWELSDLYLFPDNRFLSAISSIVIGIFILYFRDFDLKELLR